MTQFLRFCSFAAMTQLVLLLNQVILLPIQLRLWGTESTAIWYAAIAVGTITTIADLGLRTAGHMELLEFIHTRRTGARIIVSQTWGWIRVLVTAITSALLAIQAAIALLHGQWFATSWKLAITLAYALETLLTIRIVFLDSVGKYTRAEASYFSFAVLRLAAALPALLWVRVSPQGLAYLYLLSSVVGLLLQEPLCRELGILRINDSIPEQLSISTLAQVRYTLSDPLVNWLRISFPVLVLSSLATPEVITTYVALRAVFGASRTTIQQLARVASVEYLRIYMTGRIQRANCIFGGLLQLATLTATGIAGVVVLDNLRLLGLWIKHVNASSFHWIVAAFALSGAFYGYQLFVALMFRMGQLAEVATRQYAFVFYSVVFAGISRELKSFACYISLTIVAELLLATSFLLRRANTPEPSGRLAGRQALQTGLVSATILLTFCTLVSKAGATTFTDHTWHALGRSLGVLATGLIALACFQIKTLFRSSHLDSLNWLSPKATPNITVNKEYFAEQAP